MRCRLWLCCGHHCVKVISSPPRSFVCLRDSWRPEQLWTLVQRIVASPGNEIAYDSTLLNVFDGDTVALQQLVAMNVLMITYYNDVPSTLRAGERRPFLSQVFSLCHPHVLDALHACVHA